MFGMCRILLHKILSLLTFATFLLITVVAAIIIAVTFPIGCNAFSSITLEFRIITFWKNKCVKCPQMKLNKWNLNVPTLIKF